MYDIVELGLLSKEQSDQAVGLFISGFGKFMTFSKDEELKRKLYLKLFDSKLFLCYVEDGKVLGLMGLATNKKRPICFYPEICREYFGQIKGTIISKQMNVVFQSPVVKDDDELYLDVLVTDSENRRKGVGTKLLNYAFDLEGYNVVYTEVFSRNENAIRFYEKNGFIVDKEEKMSLLRFQGEGYPIKMKRERNRNGEHNS
ncbi:MAG: GNAT family N-acetyltransferase [Eubacterium sp.]|nr:GNAT family N-acetyltransferase [Eubacterium sp.]